MVDAHVHAAALPAPGNGCLASSRLLRSWLGRLVAWSQGLPLSRPEEANRVYLERLDAALAGSRLVDKGVLLAFDGVYGSDGRLDAAATDLLVANDYVFEACRRFPRLLPGASVNPARRDAVDELRRCAQAGAVLVKLLPNAQSVDLSRPKFILYWRALVELGLPLLVHVGDEFSLRAHDQRLGDPMRLRRALDEGVRVVLAHGCTSGRILGPPGPAVFAELAARYPRLYADTSAVLLPNRLRGALDLRRRPELFERLVFGTDYPLPCPSWLLPGARVEANRFDRHVQALRALGLPPGRSVLELTSG